MPASFKSDSRGAIMVIAVFMAMIAIGALYYLVGLGDAMLAQERMQDAADATAFSSAVIHARGMNLLALINIIMASVLAVLVLLAILSSLLNTGAQILAVAAIFFPGFAAGAKVLADTAKVVHSAETRAEPLVEKVLQAGHKLQGPLAKAIPVLASLNAVTLSSQSYGPVVSAGTTFPIFARLPTVDADFDKLCDKAGEFAGLMAAFPIVSVMKGIIGTATIRDKLTKHAKNAGKAYAKFFCGDGTMPTIPSITTEVALPQLNHELGATCKSDNPGDSCGQYAELQQEVHEAYNVKQAACDSTDSQIQLHCEQIRRRARQECLPGGNLISTTWVEQEVVHYFRIVGEGFDKKVIGDGSTRGEGKTRIAKNMGFASTVPCRRPPYLSDSYTDWEFDIDKPLCTEKYVPPSVGDFGSNARLAIAVKEIPDILVCKGEMEVKSKLSGEPIGDGFKANTPQEMCNCAALGEDMFQVRSIVFGDAKKYTADSDRRILIATMGTQAPSTVLGELASYAGRLAAAQAEYYFEHEKAELQSNRAEWLWHMNWKARMRRLTLGRKAWQCPEETNTCDRQVGVVGKLLPSAVADIDAFTELLKRESDDVIVH